MKIISWNVNGLRAAIKKGFKDIIKDIDPDIICLQEIKMQENQKTFQMEGYHEYWNQAEQKGYSGTLTYTKEKPQNVFRGLPDGSYNDEGRILTLEYDKFYLVNTYVPNSKRELKRLDYRMDYEDKVRTYYKELHAKKPVIITGDLNVAHQEIDIKNPSSNERNAGFTSEERTKLTTLLNEGFKDAFRELYPKQVTYSWWSYRFNSRKRDIGWRLDYFLVSNDLFDIVEDSKILTDIYGSDHAPIELIISLDQ